MAVKEQSQKKDALMLSKARRKWRRVEGVEWQTMCVRHGTAFALFQPCPGKARTRKP